MAIPEVITDRTPWQQDYLDSAAFSLSALHYQSRRKFLRTWIATNFYRSREGIDVTVTINTEAAKRQFTRESMEWLDSIPDDRHEWCDALIAGAIDECRGDLLKALELAKQTYIENPDPDNEPYPTADTVLTDGASTIPQGMAGHTVPDFPSPLIDPPDTDESQRT